MKTSGVRRKSLLKTSLFALILGALVSLPTACDDGDDSKETNNVNNVTTCDPTCDFWETCVDGACEVMEGLCGETADCPSPAETCNLELHTCDVICAPNCLTHAHCEDVEGVATCVTSEYVHWRHNETLIVDPVVNGTSLNLPVDGVSYGSMGGSLLLTSYGRDLDDPAIAYVWLYDVNSGEHTKQVLSGDLPPADENFCGGEDWCQFLGYEFVDGQSRWLVTGPRAASLMLIDTATYETTLLATSGDRPGDSFISYTHVFDMTARKLYVFGHLAAGGLLEHALRPGPGHRRVDGHRAGRATDLRQLPRRGRRHRAAL